MQPVPRTRLIVLYAVMAVAVAVVAALVLSAGEDRKAQPGIAGGYDIQGENACLGPKFDVKQSGKFVNLDNAKGTLAGQLEFEDGKLTGDADCVESGEQELDAKVADGVMTCSLHGSQFSIEGGENLRGPNGDPAGSVADLPTVEVAVEGDQVVRA